MNLLARLHEASAPRKLSFLIIGGYAVGIHGFSRVTKDLDILVEKTDSKQWLAVLQGIGYAIEHEDGNVLQVASKDENAPPLDLMLANSPTFTLMKGEAKEIQIDGRPFLVPSLDHLLALKLHALKHGPARRGFKDIIDVLSLIDANQIDVRGDKFRALCDKYGNKAIYERIIAFGQQQG